MHDLIASILGSIATKFEEMSPIRSHVIHGFRVSQFSIWDVAQEKLASLQNGLAWQIAMNAGEITWFALGI